VLKCFHKALGHAHLGEVGHDKGEYNAGNESNRGVTRRSVRDQEQNKETEDSVLKQVSDKGWEFGTGHATIENEEECQCSTEPLVLK